MVPDIYPLLRPERVFAGPHFGWLTDKTAIKPDTSCADRLLHGKKWYARRIADSTMRLIRSFSQHKYGVIRAPAVSRSRMNRTDRVGSERFSKSQIPAGRVGSEQFSKSQIPASLKAKCLWLSYMTTSAIDTGRHVQFADCPVHVRFQDR
jgi:hypothetical protein